MNKPNILVRIFSAIWSGADAVRKVLHLILLLIIFFAFIGVMSGGAPPSLPKNAALIVKPDGRLVEQLAGDPVDRAIGEARVLVVGMDGTVLLSGDGARSFRLRPQADRLGVAAALPAADRSVILVGEGGVRRLGLEQLESGR